MSFTANIDEVVSANRNGLLGARQTWKRARLKEVASILNGFPYDSSLFSKTDGAPLIRIRDILDGQTETFYQGEVEPTFLVQRGEILVGMDGDFHCSPWAGEPALLNQRVCKITPDESRYSKQFLRYVLPGYLSAINAETSSVTVKHLSSRTIADIPLPLPPIDEQRQLVAEIEKQFTRLDAGVAALRRVQANLKRYRAAVLKAACEGRLVLTEARLRKTTLRGQKRKPDLETGEQLLHRILTERRQNWQGRGKHKEAAASDITNLPTPPEGWTWASMEQLTADSMIGLDRGRAHQTADAACGVPYIKMNNVTMDGRVLFEEMMFVSASKEESEDFAVQEGDLLFNTRNSNELVGKVGLVRNPPTGAIYNNNLMRIRVSGGVSPAFMGLQMCSHGFRQRMELVKKATTNIAAVYGKDLWPLPIALPPLAEQGRIVAEVERRLSVVEELETLVQTNLQRGTRLRQSILQQAFTGKLTAET